MSTCPAAEPRSDSAIQQILCNSCYWVHGFAFDRKKSSDRASDIVARACVRMLRE